MMRRTLSYNEFKILIASFLSVISSIAIDNYHYNKLVDESCVRETGYARRMEIKEELKAMRCVKRFQRNCIGV